jgi:hypothetical protein
MVLEYVAHDGPTTAGWHVDYATALARLHAAAVIPHPTAGGQSWTQPPTPRLLAAAAGPTPSGFTAGGARPSDLTVEVDAGSRLASGDVGQSGPASGGAGQSSLASGGVRQGSLASGGVGQSSLVPGSVGQSGLASDGAGPSELVAGGAAPSSSGADESDVPSSSGADASEVPSVHGSGAAAAPPRLGSGVSTEATSTGDGLPDRVAQGYAGLPDRVGPGDADVRAFLAFATRVGVAVPGGAEDQLAALVGRLAKVGRRALLHGDPCPDNEVPTAAGMRFIDLEQAAWGPGTTELAYLTMAFPTCLCATATSDAVLADALAAYRGTWRAITGTEPDGDLTDAAVGWLISGDALVWRARRGEGDHLARAARRDWRWGTGTARERILHRLGVVAHAARDRDDLAQVARLCADLSAAMLRRWTGLAPLPVATGDPLPDRGAA